ncbi:hypothetical protein BLNAU_13153 [Blattamonas nauphoetae]|uniref:Uncharacterized protein n=1 Tax=Blattamonas nauphoetae TaxID=2049346 RepID=A0ABQ9XIQ6_9EUKA|nr:hypothetical protein BLNAU_13153 [Blattamonas nauphoetae]
MLIPLFQNRRPKPTTTTSTTVQQPLPPGTHNLISNQPFSPLSRTITFTPSSESQGTNQSNPSQSLSHEAIVIDVKPAPTRHPLIQFPQPRGQHSQNRSNDRIRRNPTPKHGKSAYPTSQQQLPSQPTHILVVDQTISVRDLNNNTSQSATPKQSIRVVHTNHTHEIEKFKTTKFEDIPEFTPRKYQTPQMQSTPPAMMHMPPYYPQPKRYPIYPTQPQLPMQYNHSVMPQLPAPPF